MSEDKSPEPLSPTLIGRRHFLRLSVATLAGTAGFRSLAPLSGEESMSPPADPKEKQVQSAFKKRSSLWIAAGHRCRWSASKAAGRFRDLPSKSWKGTCTNAQERAFPKSGWSNPGFQSFPVMASWGQSCSQPLPGPESSEHSSGWQKSFSSDCGSCLTIFRWMKPGLKHKEDAAVTSVPPSPICVP